MPASPRRSTARTLGHGCRPPALVANKGDNLGIPDWTANLGVQYDTAIMGYPVYARADYAYQGKYMRATSCQSYSPSGNPPSVNCTASFAAAPYVTPNYINGNDTHIMNARSATARTWKSPVT